MSDSTPPPSSAAGEREQQLETVIAKYIRACEAGLHPNRREILEQYPDLAGQLKQFFAQRDRLNQLAEPIRAFEDDLFHAIGTGQQLSYIGNYELLEEVARGGMGVVYKARQATLNRIVAVKMIVSGRLANEQDVQRFESEAQAAASLNHPSIVSIHEVGQHEGWHYFSMDYVDGRDLSTILRLNLLPAKTAAAYVHQMAEAIHYAHQKGILHRDLKPSNILIDHHDQVHITDFGLAMRVEGDQGLTQTGQIVGTPSYMPPEQAQCKRGLIGPASDVYALGAILYECLTGRPPFRAESAIKTLDQVIHAEAASPRTLNASIPRDLETICLKCLEKEPHRRFGTAQLLADDIGRFLIGEPIVARPANALERSVKWVRRHPTPTALIASIAIALLAIVGAGIGLYCNAQLESTNSQLQLSNLQLGQAKTTLEASNQQLSLASADLELAMDNVKAERGLAHRHLYASRMALIQVALQNDQPARVVELLRSVIPETKNQEDLRDFEWHHLWRKYHGEQLQLAGHTGPVTCVACSHDEKWIAAGSGDHSISVWNAATGEQHYRLSGHLEGITDIAFSNDSQHLVSCSNDKTIKLWSVVSAKELFTLIGHEVPVTSVAFSSDGTHIASGDGSGTVIFWDGNSGQKSAMLQYPEAIIGLEFHPKNNMLAIAGRLDSKILQPFEVDQPVIRNLPKSVTQLAFSPDGQSIAFGSTRKPDSSVISIWDIEKDKAIQSINIPTPVGEVAFSHDGALVAASGYDQTVKVWDSETGTEICTFHAGDAVRSFTFTPDGGRIAGGTESGTILLWDVPGKEVRTVYKGSPCHCVVFLNKDLLFARGGEGFSIWDVKSGQVRKTFEHRGKVVGRFAVSNQKNWIAGATIDELIDAFTGQTITKLHEISDQGDFRIGQFEFSRDEKFVAATFGTNTVDMWDTASGSLLRRFETQPMSTSVAFSPDGELLASGSAWLSSVAKNIKYKNQPIAKAVPETCFLRVWETKTGRQVFYKEEPYAGGIWDLTFSPDGRKLAVAMGRYAEQGTTSGHIRLWDVLTWRIVHDLRGHSGSVWSVAFNASGTRLVSGSGHWLPKYFGQAKVWDVITGMELLTLANALDPVFGVAFSPDGRRLATANRNGLIRIWDGSPFLSSLTNFEPLTFRQTRP